MLTHCGLRVTIRPVPTKGPVTRAPKTNPPEVREECDITVDFGLMGAGDLDLIIA